MSNVTTIWRNSAQKRDISRRHKTIRAEQKRSAKARAGRRRKELAAKADRAQIEADRQAAWAARQLSFAFDSPIGKAVATLGAARKRVS